MVSEHASPLATIGGVDAGGQNLYVADLAQTLAAAGHDVTVYTRQDDPDLPREAELTPGAVVEHVPAGPAEPISKDQLVPYLPEFARYLAQRWATRTPDVVHAHFWMSGMVSLSAAREVDLPIVQTFHALGAVKRRHQKDLDTSPTSRIRMESEIARRADRTIATCSDEVFELVRMGVRRTSITTIPCGVDPEIFCPNGPTEQRDGRPRILSVGRLVPRKGFELLIRALPQVPEAELVIAGGPPADQLDADPEARRLMALARRMRVANRVRFLGGVTRQRMPGLLRSADVVACVPWYEPFGMVAVEAMACGVPVVASAVGGLTDTVFDDLTGLLIPPRRVDVLAGALNRVLGDPMLRDACGIAGADRARARYSWTRIGAEMVRTYRDVISRRQSVASPEMVEAQS